MGSWNISILNNEYVDRLDHDASIMNNINTNIIILIEYFVINSKKDHMNQFNRTIT